MGTFALKNPHSRKEIHWLISKIISNIQHEYQYTTSRRVFLVKNRVLVNTCMNLAAESVKLHGIADDQLTNEKKWAHLTFWLIKLCPISYVVDLPLSAGIMGRSDFSDKPIKLDDDEKKFPHQPVNTKTAFHLFVALFCHNQFTAAEAKQKYREAIKASYSEEIVKSFRAHNYSARSMAMFLETLMMEKLV